MIYILILICILCVSVMRIEFKYKLFIFLLFTIIYLAYYKEQILFAPLLCVSAFTIIFFIFILLDKLNKKYKNTDREINVKMISFSLIIISGAIALSYLFFIDSFIIKFKNDKVLKEIERKEKDKIKKIEFYKSTNTPTVFNVIMKEKPEPCYFRDLWRKYNLDKEVLEKYKLNEDKELLFVFLFYEVVSSEISGKFSRDKCLDEMVE